MSCRDCEAQQELAFNKNISKSPPIGYLRVGNSNVAIVGCDKHLKELIDKFRSAEKRGSKK